MRWTKSEICVCVVIRFHGNTFPRKCIYTKINFGMRLAKQGKNECKYSTIQTNQHRIQNTHIRIEGVKNF